MQSFSDESCRDPSRLMRRHCQSGSIRVRNGYILDRRPAEPSSLGPRPSELAIELLSMISIY